MDQTPSRIDAAGEERVSRPRVTRAQNRARSSFDQSFPSVHTANPGRAPVQNSQERSPYAYRSETARLRAVPAQDGWAQEPPRGRGTQRDWRNDYNGPSKKKNSHPFLYATVIMICTLLLISLGLFAAPQWLGVHWQDMPNYAFVNGSIIQMDASQIASYKQMRSQAAGDTILPGVFVDDVDVGGMTIDQAKAAIGGGGKQSDNGFSITVSIGNRTWPIDSSRVPITRNVDEMLTKAFAQGRQNSTAIINTSVTPFEQRLGAAQQLKAQNVRLYSEMTYDKATVRGLTDAIVSYVNRDPVDAQVQSFDFGKRTFTFTDEAPGVHVDGDALYQQVIAKLDAREYGTTLTVTPEIITPKATKVELMNSFRLISTYTTETTNNSNRNTNVDLSSQAINGRTVMPGETFSFNKTTGQRTEAKGYKEAIAISGGQSVPDIGGGVCQTSSTLFNAVARADLEIVDRSPHAWPSTYVEKGLDATVNWPGLDFKFRNNKNTPIFIISWYKDRKITVEIYGMSLGTGVSIDLVSKVTQTLKPPADVKYVQNTSLPVGSSEETIKARTGYVVETYKVWYRDGKEIKRDKMFTSTYRPFQRTVEWN